MDSTAPTPLGQQPTLIPLAVFMVVFGCISTATGLVALGLVFVVGRESVRHGLVAFAVMSIAFLLLGAVATLLWSRGMARLGAAPAGRTELDPGAAVGLLLRR